MTEHVVNSVTSEGVGMTYPSDNDPAEQEAKQSVLTRFPCAKENPYGDNVCRPGLVFAPFVGGWCKIGESWQEAKKAFVRLVYD
jgi:hypothetical protein